ncbi:MAG: hypothetical protein WC243_01865 [Patescibacteria group bacterium]
MLPHSYLWGASSRVARIIDEAELDGGQFLPFLGLESFDQVFAFNDPRFGFYEGRWGNGPLDKMLFGSRERSDALERRFAEHCPNAKVTSHRWGDPLVEINPEMGHVLRSVDELLQYPHGVAWDPWHVLRKAHDGGPSILEHLNTSYLDLVRIVFEADVVREFHFQPPRNEPWGWAVSEILSYTLRCLAGTPSVVPIIIETKPLAYSLELSETATINYLAEVRQFIVSCVG